jgi:HEAT repeat protein
VSAAAGDLSREVRITVAAGLAEIGDAAAGPVLAGLANDDDPLVRAAALSAAGQLGCPAPLLERALAMLAGDRAWQVRVGAAQALQGAASSPRGAAGSHPASPAGGDVADVVVGALAAGGGDPHADVRKAAIIALGEWSRHPGTAAALEAALADSDADVRGYARRALAGPAPVRARPGR